MKTILTFVNTVDQLINQKLSGDGKLYIETKRNEYISFRPKDFRLKLQHVACEKNINKYLSYYKLLGFIVSNEKDSFTHVQRYKRKVLRVITVDRVKYETLKELIKEGNKP